MIQHEDNKKEHEKQVNIEILIDTFCKILKPKGNCYFFIDPAQMKKINNKEQIKKKYPNIIIHFFSTNNLLQ